MTISLHSEKPVFIVGVPRSGTSLVTGLLSISGLWTGGKWALSDYNKKGNFENEVLKNRFVKPLLLLAGACPLGIKSFPEYCPSIEPEYLKKEILDLIEYQGGGEKWAFKDCKMILLKTLFKRVFPEAVWVFVERDKNSVIQSAMNAEPLARVAGMDYDFYSKWFDRYHSFKDEADVVISANKIISGDFSEIKKLVEDMGLEWRKRAVMSFVDSTLWGGK